MGLAWIAIFAAGFILFTFRDNFGWVAQRLKAEAVGTPVQQGQGNSNPDGDRRTFLGRRRVNGQEVKFLVDSGATMTTIDRKTAEAAGVTISPRAISSCGQATASSASRAAERRPDVGGIKRHDVAIQVADNDDLNVLGMNYLSSLSRWSVEGRWLVLVP